jgi:hypothetical protein
LTTHESVALHVFQHFFHPAYRWRMPLSQWRSTPQSG